MLALRTVAQTDFKAIFRFECWLFSVCKSFLACNKCRHLHLFLLLSHLHFDGIRATERANRDFY